MTATATAARNVVVLAADARLFPAAVFAAARLAMLNSRADTDIAIFTDSAGDRDKATQLSLPVTVRLGETPRGVANAPLYLRFAALDALRREYRRMLYLDVDTWVEDAAFFSLFDLDMAGYPVAGVRDGVIAFVPGNSERVNTVGSGTKYLNTGLLMVDGPSYSADRLGSRLEQIVHEQRRPFLHHDQSALNLLLQGNWLELSPAFNLLAIQLHTFVARVCPPIVVHFAGPAKPWLGPHFTLDHPAREAMERYFPHSPWRDFLPGFIDLAVLLDPSKIIRQGNFDMSFAGKSDFVRYLRETDFADVKAGITALQLEHLPAA